jgi:hypothetical protein
MELSLYSLCIDRTVNSLLIVGTECLLNNCPATASYVVPTTVESSPWQRCREVFTATLCSNQCGPARLGTAQRRHRFDHPRYSIHALMRNGILIKQCISENNKSLMMFVFIKPLLTAQKHSHVFRRPLLVV